ncbi:MAG: hypothetical protein WA113_06655 [Desulfitobacteriaceae bacterium]
MLLNLILSFIAAFQASIIMTLISPSIIRLNWRLLICKATYTVLNNKFQKFAKCFRPSIITNRS